MLTFAFILMAVGFGGCCHAVTPKPYHEGINWKRVDNFICNALGVASALTLLVIAALSYMGFK